MTRSKLCFWTCHSILETAQSSAIQGGSEAQGLSMNSLLLVHKRASTEVESEHLESLTPAQRSSSIQAYYQQAHRVEQDRDQSVHRQLSGEL